MTGREGVGWFGGLGLAFQDVEVQAKYMRSERSERTERGQMLFTLQVSQQAQSERELSAVLSHQECA